MWGEEKFSIWEWQPRDENWLAVCELEPGRVGTMPGSISGLALQYGSQDDIGRDLLQLTFAGELNTFLKWCILWVVKLGMQSNKETLFNSEYKAVFCCLKYDPIKMAEFTSYWNVYKYWLCAWPAKERLK